MSNSTKRTRRGEAELIADLEAKIATLKARAEAKKVRRDPALRHERVALRSLDKALAGTEDAAMRTALDEARVTLSACLQLHGVGDRPANGRAMVVPRTRGLVDVDHGHRNDNKQPVDVDEGQLFDYIQAHPGQRGEEIASALGTDTKSMRPTVRKLIENRRVKTKGQARGMQYYPV
jgi:hypothetical protein